MKKILSLTLAAAMVLSLASVAFASGDNLTSKLVASDVDSMKNLQCYFDNDSDMIKDARNDIADPDDDHKFGYGETVYYPLVGTTAGGKFVVYESAAVKGLKVKAEWHMGEEYVEGVELIKKKTDDTVADLIKGSDAGNLAGAERYAYYIAVEIKDTMRTDDADIYGTIELNKKETKNSSGTPNGDKLDDDRFDVNLTVEYAKVDATGSSATLDNDDLKVFDFGTTGSDDFELTIIDNDTAVFTVDTRGQGDLVMAANNDFNTAISKKYPMANLEFINIEASDSFNRIGELRVYAEEENYLYALDDKGEVVNSKAKYDADDECYVMRTRNLNGSFVLSDTELDMAPVAPVVPEVKPEGRPVNPPTGAAC